MIKKVFQCDPIQWTVLFAVIIGSMAVRVLILPLDCGSIEETSQIGLRLQGAHWALGLLKLLAIILLPFWFRGIIRQSSVLDFRERVSLYPMALFMVPTILSCNSLIWLIIVALLMSIFSSIVRLKEDDSLTSAAFRSGFLISLCSFFSPYFFFLALFVLPSFSIVRALNWKSAIWNLIGIISPWYLGYSIYYIVKGQLDFYALTDTLLVIPGSISPNGNSTAFIMYLIVIISLTILMLRFSLLSARTGAVRRRKFLRIGALFFVVCLLISALILQFESVTPMLSLMAIPLSVIYLEMFKEEYSRLHAFLFILWVIATYVFVWK